jgi:GAF domain-containing protein
VIAIENARLFEAEPASKRELQESLKYQTAISEVLSVISRSQTEIRPVFTILESPVRLCDADQGGTGKVENGMLVAINWYPDTPEISTVFRDNFPRPVDRTSLIGRAVIEGRVLHVPDLETADAQKVSTTVSKAFGYRSQLTVPLVRNGQTIGVLALVRKAPEPFTHPQIALATTFADQAVITIENTRLFDEVQARTRELAKTVEDLEIASQHKNQFVANMSHELRTPLAAILGYAELMQEDFYGDQSEKSMDALTRIRSNSRRLLGLINTVLDIAKIESGQFTLNMAEYDIESVVETVRAAGCWPPPITMPTFGGPASSMSPGDLATLARQTRPRMHRALTLSAPGVRMRPGLLVALPTRTAAPAINRVLAIGRRGCVSMASAMTDRSLRARLAGASLALLMFSACSQEPAEHEPGSSAAKDTSGPARHQQATIRADCRGEVAAAFERRKTSGRPYREEATVNNDGRTFHETIEFVPPDQLRLSNNSIWIMNEYYIGIGQRAWANWTPFPWGWREEYPDPRITQMKLRASDDFAPELNVPPPVYECLGMIELEGTAYLGYRARFQRRTIAFASNGAFSETTKQELDRKLEQRPQEWRTVFVDPESRLPAYEIVAQENQLGNPSSKVRYTYPNNITIEPPLWCRLGLCRSAAR